MRDFGVGLVCVGGDQTYAAGGYRGTPLEETLPVNMELDSKKVLPKGAVALVMHGMEFVQRQPGRARLRAWACCRRWGRRMKWASCFGMATSTGCFR